MGAKIEKKSGGVVLTVKVTPKAKQNKIAGWENNVLKIYVTAAPEKGQANLAAVALLSEHFHIAKNRIILLRGATSRNKEFLLEGLNLDLLLKPDLKKSI